VYMKRKVKVFSSSEKCSFYSTLEILNLFTVQGRVLRVLINTNGISESSGG